MTYYLRDALSLPSVSTHTFSEGVALDRLSISGRYTRLLQSAQTGSGYSVTVVVVVLVVLRLLTKRDLPCAARVNRRPTCGLEGGECLIVRLFGGACLFTTPIASNTVSCLIVTDNYQ